MDFNEAARMSVDCSTGANRFIASFPVALGPSYPFSTGVHIGLNAYRARNLSLRAKVTCVL